MKSSLQSLLSSNCVEVKPEMSSLDLLMDGGMYMCIGEWSTCWLHACMDSDASTRGSLTSCHVIVELATSVKVWTPISMEGGLVLKARNHVSVQVMDKVILIRRPLEKGNLGSLSHSSKKQVKHVNEDVIYVDNYCYCLSNQLFFYTELLWSCKHGK